MAKSTKAKKVVSKKQADSSKTTQPNKFVGLLVSIGGYFVGAWRELQQVRWPSRRATWELTLAVIIFSAFFAILILLLDFLFKYLFELIII